jgi:hypothetical protein
MNYPLATCFSTMIFAANLVFPTMYSAMPQPNEHPLEWIKSIRDFQEEMERFLHPRDVYQREINALLFEQARTGKSSDAALCISYLVAQGAQIDAREEIHGFTPLHCAAIRGQQKTIHALLDSDANPLIRDNVGRTASYYVEIQYNFVKRAIKLFKAITFDPKKACPCKPNPKLIPFFFEAVIKGSFFDACAFCNPYACDENKNTALHMIFDEAMSDSHLDIIYMLLLSGANPNAQNAGAQTAFDVANAKLATLESIHELLSKNKSPVEQKSDGYSKQ